MDGWVDSCLPDSKHAKYSLPSGLSVSLGQCLFAMRSWTIEMIVATMLPMEMAAKTAPFCSVVKLCRVRKIKGRAEKVMYRTAHAKEAQSEKKKTTGSVARSLKGRVRETYSM